MNTETRYTVKQLAGVAGISARTLHYYDEIGLLTPARHPENGYRLYDRAALLRLQQILFLRELDFSLDAIQTLLDRPDFDLLNALQNHRKALLARQKRLGDLLHTVERTISHLKGTLEMSSEDLFKGFTEQERKWSEEAQQRWDGEQFRESVRRWSSYSEEEKQRIKEEGREIYLAIVAAMPHGPASPQAQEGIARWHQNIRHFYEPTREVLLGLGDLYNDDPDFNATFVKIHPDLAAFMREAIQIYCKE